MLSASPVTAIVECFVQEAFIRGGAKFGSKGFRRILIRKVDALGRVAVRHW